MSEPKKCIAYVFAFVRKIPTTREQLNAVYSIKQQMQLLTIGGKSLNIEFAKVYHDITTYRKKPFTRMDNFKYAVAHCEKDGLPLVFADLQHLLNTTDASLLTEVGMAIQNIRKIEILDFTYQSVVSKDPGIINKMVSNAKYVSSMKSSAIKSGLQENKPGKRSPSGRTQKSGAIQNAKNADWRALQHNSFVQDAIRTHGKEGKISPSLLARMLNKAGIKPVRAEAWKPTSAANLLKRILSNQNKTDDAS